MTGMINVLYLTGSFFMLEVYDRVLPSRSVPTLVGLAVIAFVLYAFQGVLDVLRGRVLVRIGASLDEALSGRVFDILVRLPLKARPAGDGLQPIRDLDQVRSFLSGLGPTALFDLPWMPLYIAICFLFHVWIGVAALLGAVLLIGVTLLTEFRTREPTRSAVMTGMARNALAEASRRNAEVLQAMGMGSRIGDLWGQANAKYMASQQRASDVAGGLGAPSKVMRLALQSVELGIANWRGFAAARQSWKRLTELLAALPTREAPMALPRPSTTFSVEGVSATPPGVQRFVVQDVAFSLKAGNGLGIIGPSASGKSSLARLLVGVWTPMRGKVRLDGAAFEQWDPEALGKHIGYLPQDVELFAGTVAENIARFEPEPDAEAILQAARAAKCTTLFCVSRTATTPRSGRVDRALGGAAAARRACARALPRPVPARV